MATDARIKADTIDDLLSIQALALCIGIQFIKVSYAQCQIGIGEQLNSLSFGEAHEQGVDVLFNCAFLKQTSKLVSSHNQTLIVQISSNDSDTDCHTEP